MKKSIVWFKTDLRLRDNETLAEAVKHSDEILPVYCIDQRDLRVTEFGLNKTGSFRMQFILESLRDLDDQLRKKGSGLFIVKGKPENALLKIATQYGISKVYAQREVAFEEKRTEAKVEKELGKINCILETHGTSTLYHPDDLPFSLQDLPDVFTNFRKRVEKESLVRSLFDTPDYIKSPSIQSLSLPTPEESGIAATLNDPRAAYYFKGGSTEAHKRLHHYFSGSQAVSTYKETRNSLLGADYSTKFSAWLAQGCLSPREIYHELKKYEAIYGENESTYWVVFELMWRDYFRFVMTKYGHKLFLKNGIKTGSTHLNMHDSALFQQWVSGTTGVDFVDANMNELRLTGFMSNRGRQNVASYLVNDLKLDWRYGAAYFEQQLIDYDVCSNWGNWAYLAGVGNDPRGQRYFNIEKQAHDYDPSKLYRDLWLNN
jgi:deoxyribodipyrimidine photo-lyase